MATSPADRAYEIPSRGDAREALLADFREGLRQLPDPATGEAFTEDTIRRATAFGSRFWRQAESLDVTLLGVGKNAEFFAQQTRLDRAGTGWLENYHGPLWGESELPAFGGSGNVAATGNPGTIFQGSTLVPDELALQGTDPAGNRYQAVLSATADGAGEATLLLIAVDGGSGTNPTAGTTITWVNPPPGAQPTASVGVDGFSGGIDAETDEAFAKRLAARVRHKPGSGNWAHFRALARQASAAVSDAFVYPCAFYAGSVLVAVVQKRTTAGPLARVPSFSVLSAVTGMLVPPGSPAIPGRVHVVVAPVQPQEIDLALQLSLPLGSAAGWIDLAPFPPIDGSARVTITTVSSQTDFQLTTSAAGLLPGGVAGPLTGVHLMVWDVSSASFESLLVASVTDVGAGVYGVLLAAEPVHTLVVGDIVSPDSLRRDAIAEGVTEYFDSLGPGEVVNLTTDERGSRAYRNPVPAEESPARAGSSVTSYLADALGSALADALLASISASTPSLPSDPVDGPRLLVLGTLGVYAL
jgi:hypothetical protein